MEPQTRGFSRLYCNECIIEGCETNTQLVKMFVELDKTDGSNDPTTLDFSRTYLGDRNVAALCKVISTMFTVTEVSFANMDLQAHGVGAICAMAAKHPRIYRIDLRGNHLYATSGRHISKLLQHTKRITQCFVDCDEMPDRVRSSVLRYLGRNIAAKFPQLPLDQQPDITVLDGEDEHRHEGGVTAVEMDDEGRVVEDSFETRLSAEATQHRAMLSECYSRCGLFAIQTFADLGPKGLELLHHELPRFHRPSQDQIFSVEPLEVLAHSVFEEEVETLLSSSHLRSHAEGTVLWDQIVSCKEQIETLVESLSVTNRTTESTDKANANAEGTFTDVSKLLQHVRRSVGGHLSGTMGALDDNINTVSTNIVDVLWEKTRKLIVMHDRVRYFCMDYPDMVKDVMKRYQSSQPPLRDTWATLMHEVRYVARSPFAKGRRELLAEAIELLPLDMSRFILHRLIGWSLDRSVGCRGFHSLSMGTDEESRQVDFCDVIGHKFLTRGQLRSFFVLYANHARYHAIVGGWPTVIGQEGESDKKPTNQTPSEEDRMAVVDSNKKSDDN